VWFVEKRAFSFEPVDVEVDATLRIFIESQVSLLNFAFEFHCTPRHSTDAIFFSR